MEILLNSLFTAMPMFTSGFWTLVLLFQYRDRDRAKIVLTFFMLTATVLYFAHCAFFNKAYPIIPFTDTLYSFSTVAVYPLYYIYIIALTGTKRFSIKSYIILIPALLLGICVGLVYLLMDKEQTTLFLNNYLYSIASWQSDDQLLALQKNLHNIIKLAFTAQLVPILWFGMKRISEYNKKVASCFSNTENKDLRSIRFLLFFFMITSICSFVANIIGRKYFVDSIILLAIPSILFSVLIFCIGNVGLNQKFTAKDLYTEYDYKETPDNKAEDSAQLKNKITNLVRDEKLYLTPNLKISDIATRLGTNKTYIYNAINVDMQVSFSEFINRQRIEHAQELMRANDKVAMMDVLTDSGFTSEPSFYRNFKRFTGLTPHQWALSCKHVNSKIE